MHVRSLVCAVFAAALLAVATSAVASATTVTVSPTGNKSSLFYVSKFSFVNTSKVLNCTYLDSVATLDTGHVVMSVNYWLAFEEPCTVTGGVGVTFSCLANARWTVTGVTSGGVTPGTISGLSCTTTVNGAPTCLVRISGSVDVTYNNSGSVLTVSPTSQSLAATGSTCVLLPNDSNVRFTNSVGTGASTFLSPSTTITAT